MTRISALLSLACFAFFTFVFIPAGKAQDFCSSFDRNEAVCDNTPGCEYYMPLDRCFPEQGGGANTGSCSDFDFNPSICEDQLNCHFNGLTRRCEYGLGRGHGPGGRPGSGGVPGGRPSGGFPGSGPLVPAGCAAFDNDPRACNAQPRCAFNFQRRQCGGRFP